MTALYVILGIIAFLIILLSIKLVITVHYEDDVSLSVGWLFLKFNILPKKEKEDKNLDYFSNIDQSVINFIKEGK